MAPGRLNPRPWPCDFYKKRMQVSSLWSKPMSWKRGLLESLLSLSQIDFGDGRFVQVLLSGNGSLNAQLERPSEGTVARQVRVERWLLAPQPQVRIRLVSSGSGTAFRDRRPDEPVQASPLRAVPPSPGTSPAGGSRFFRRFVAFVLLAMGATTVGWFAADHFWTGVRSGQSKQKRQPKRLSTFPRPDKIRPARLISGFDHP